MDYLRVPFLETPKYTSSIECLIFGTIPPGVHKKSLISRLVWKPEDELCTKQTMRRTCQFLGPMQNNMPRKLLVVSNYRKIYLLRVKEIVCPLFGEKYRKHLKPAPGKSASIDLGMQPYMRREREREQENSLPPMLKHI